MSSRKSFLWHLLYMEEECKLELGPFQKFWSWHLKDRKLIFYVKGKDELMKVELMKDKDKDFMCLI